MAKVLLLIETSNSYARGLLSGIMSYMQERRPWWSVYLAEQSRGEPAPSWVGHWEGDGALVRIENAAIAVTVEKLGIPTVDMSSARLIPSLPWFETDDLAVGRLAAEHLLERGFRRFGFVGDPAYNWSRWREQHFKHLVQQAGYECTVLQLPGSRRRDGEAAVKAIAAWIARLSKPLGVMAAYDFLGQQVLDACRRRSIMVPEEVAVIGVDNDEVFCGLADPPMSSVILNNGRTGYEAAALLDRLMEGTRCTGEGHLFEPLGVATRQSTDVLAIEDRNLVQVIRFIREHACEGINVKDVLKAVPQSRRVLEGRFAKMLGRTPHEEINRVQLNQAKLLLRETELSLEQISERCGFAHVEYLSVVFRKKLGLPPSQYRAQNQRKRTAFVEDPQAVGERMRGCEQRRKSPGSDSA